MPGASDHTVSESQNIVLFTPPLRSRWLVRTQPLLVVKRCDFMEKRTWRFGRLAVAASKFAWYAANVLILAWSLRLDSQQRYEEQVLTLLAMIILSFPLGWLFFLLIGLLDVLLKRQISTSMPAGSWGVLLQWGCFLLVGYLQWFKLVPYFVRKLRAKRLSGRHEV